MKQIHFKQSKICCISDIHLGVHQNSSQWHKILLDWVNWLKDELKNNDIKDIMICGDLFHDRDEIAVNSLNIATSFFNILSDFNIVMITGNHDCYYKDTSSVNSLSIFNGWSNIHVIESIYTDIFFGKKVTFAPWGVKVNDIPKSDLIFGHFELTNFKMNNFKVCDHGLHPENILKKAKKIITGHFHLRDCRKFKSGEILYLGNPFQMDFGDAGSVKGWYELDFNTLETVFHENHLSPYHNKIFLSELIKNDGITKTVKKIVHNNIIKLIVDKNIEPSDLEFLSNILNGLKPISYIVDYDINYNKFSTDNNLDYTYSGVDYETAIEDFISMLDINNKPEVIRYTKDLYNSCK